MDKVTIATITYNCKDVIEKTINSVLEQTYNNIEYVIVDGGSNDGTLDVIMKYEHSIDIIISEPDNGIYDAMNKAIKIASGKWILFLNAGDLFYENNSVESIMSLYDGNSDILFGNAMYIYDYCAFIPNFPQISKMSKYMPMCHQSTFVKLSYHKEHPFDTSFRSSGDYNFLYQAYLIDKVKFQGVNIIISIYDATEGMSKMNYSLSMRENLRIWNKQTNWIFRIILEIEIILFYMKSQIKKKVFSDKTKKYLEIRRLRNIGQVISK